MPDEARTPTDSEVTLAQLMLPNDANPAGDVHGGVVMALVDTAAGLAATQPPGSTAFVPYRPGRLVGAR